MKIQIFKKYIFIYGVIIAYVLEGHLRQVLPTHLAIMSVSRHFFYYYGANEEMSG